MRTPEEKRLAHNAWQREWNRRNKEKKAEADRLYRLGHLDEKRRKDHEYYLRTKDRDRAARKKWQEDNATKTAIQHRRTRIKRVYGLTHREFWERVWDQQGGCAICGCSFQGMSFKEIHIDHDHRDGWIRGLLCGSCNRLIGIARDHVDRLQAAIAYLQNDFGMETGE